MSQRFPRSARLLNSWQFRRVFDRGRSRSDRLLIVYVCPREEGEEGTRLGLVVGRRYGNSPKRNAWKRRVREAFRARRPGLPPDHDLVVLPVGRGEVPQTAKVAESLVRVAQVAAQAYVAKGPK